MEDCNTKVERPEKHLELFVSIGRIDRISRRLEDLACRIKSNQSSPPDPSETKKEITPSLTDVLEAGSDKISGKVERCISIISEIESLLF